jgi:hypothetical protein
MNPLNERLLVKKREAGDVSVIEEDKGNYKMIRTLDTQSRSILARDFGFDDHWQWQMRSMSFAMRHHRHTLPLLRQH